MDKVVRTADLEALLDEQGVRWRRGSGPAEIVVPCEIANEEARLVLTLAPRLLHCHLLLPASVPESSREAAALAVCRLNQDLSLPGFGFDTDTGSLYYRVTVPCEDDGLSAAVVRSVLATCVSTAEERWQEVLRSASPGSSAGEVLHAGHASLRAAKRPSQGFNFADVSVTPRAVGKGGDRGAHTSVREVAWESGQAWIYDGESDEILGRIDAPVRNGKPRARALVDGEWQPPSSEKLGRRLRDRGAAARAIWRRGPGEADLEPVLIALGFEPAYDEVLVERSLEEPLPLGPEDGPGPGRRLPPSALLAALVKRAMRDSKNRSVQGPEGRRIRELSREGSGDKVADRWRVWEIDGEPAGVALLDRVLADGSGSLQFFGLVPERRGQGLARALHAAALTELARSGCRHYCDAADVDNRAMQRIFFCNGCRRIGTLKHFRRRDRLGASRPPRQAKLHATPRHEGDIA